MLSEKTAAWLSLSTWFSVSMFLNQKKIGKEEPRIFISSYICLVLSHRVTGGYFSFLLHWLGVLQSIHSFQPILVEFY